MEAASVYTEGFGSVNGVDKAALELQSAAVVTWVVARFTTTFYLKWTGQPPVWCVGGREEKKKAKKKKYV